MKNKKNVLFNQLNKRNFFQDDKARSLSFFCKDEIKSPLLDNSLLDIMKKISKAHKTDLRLNLHSSPKDNHHDMIILQRRNYKCPVHKHLSNGETIHVIYGSLDVILFNDKKKNTSKISLSKKEKIIYRIPTNLYHTVKITSPFAIYHESKRGPFVRTQTILAR
ncbi:WbuC family cupin fold metalloprotein [Candidatus Pelagibacter sp.]|nr:WbuC family cupin fold metalloprotein [Candidatus Pelagibacter sp.]